MGACEFSNFVLSKGDKDTANEAFRRAVDEARYYHGHAGYTGTIAEKHDFGMLCHKPVTHAEGIALMQANDERETPKFGDKWGPAGCVPIDDPEKGKGWYFFGWASS